MMQVNFKFSPPSVAVLGKAVHQTSVVLLRGIEVGVYKGLPFMVAASIDRSGVFRGPLLDPAFLLGEGGAGPPVFWHNGRLKMIGKSEDEVDYATLGGAGKLLPGMSRHPSGVREFAYQARLLHPRSYSLRRGFPCSTLSNPVSLFAHRTLAEASNGADLYRQP
jgi:hypothetical protein